MVSGIGSSGFSMADMGISPMRRPDPKDIFNKLDSNEDGSLDTSEVTAFEAEIQKHIGGMGRKPPSLMKADANADSKLSLDEFMAGAEKMRPSGPPPGGRSGSGQDISSLLEALKSEEPDEESDSLDTNKDGIVDSEELQTGLSNYTKSMMQAYAQSTNYNSDNIDVFGGANGLNIEA